MRGGRPPMGGSEPPIMGEGNFPDDMGERPMMNKEQNVEDIQKKAAEAKKKKIKKILTPEQYVQSPNQKIPDRKTKCVIKTHINIKQNVIFSAKLKPV